MATTQPRHIKIFLHEVFVSMQCTQVHIICTTCVISRTPLSIKIKCECTVESIKTITYQILWGIRESREMSKMFFPEKIKQKKMNNRWNLFCAHITLLLFLLVLYSISITTKNNFIKERRHSINIPYDTFVGRSHKQTSSCHL